MWMMPLHLHINQKSDNDDDDDDEKSENYTVFFYHTTLSSGPLTVLQLRNRSALAVNCCVIIHCLEVSCKD